MRERHSALFTSSYLTILALAFLSAESTTATAEPFLAQRQIVFQIRPSETDKRITRFDEPHFVVLDQDFRRGSRLVVFMPGTGTSPGDFALLLRTVADQGFRTIGLEYNNTPGVMQVCEHVTTDNCAGEFRRRRVFGEGGTPFTDDTSAESVINRLVKLLKYLERSYPQNGWRIYFEGDTLDWSRIVVSGFSQGAGMAAYIAKRRRVARVVLFSSPWDYIPPLRSIAPWLSEPSLTPTNRWYAEYHISEPNAGLIRSAYETLQIPDSHIHIFNPIRQGSVGQHGASTHSSTVTDPSYESQWRSLFGKSK